ncbi:MAG: fasciclin domain-containing protein [Planctomycetota bacterium]
MSHLLPISLASAAIAALAGTANAGGCGYGNTASNSNNSVFISHHEEERPSIFELALTTESPSLKTLATLVAAADLDAALSSGEFTVFAPTDEAFGKLPDGTVSTLLGEDGRPTLKTILTYHVVAGTITSDAIPAGTTKVKTLAGKTLEVTRHGSDIRINGNKVIAADVAASNGVVHVIGGVLLPN